MRSLFEDLVRDGASAVRSLAGRAEEIDFDCKLKADATKGAVDREDKANLGKTLSAFSNSMGGLLLWGVDARRDSAGIDAITGFQPIVDIRRFESDVRTLCGEALMPRHSGIEVRSIPDGDAPESGFLVVWVERSERRPHRPELGDK